ncbi:FCD domain-containing protein [Hyphomonas sp. WL0036]|uniref:FadR/GntR family transcriptional regulator n=1 Tax=Hyphomonas sediminis TaxID=2866160 RepID=UPI001C8090A6|nr:FCD domain-containing protein [Hyphomonas sediminis]MBY9067506.1 FCD domain-containing protein [Hyphomonas sediminis]
MKNFEPKGILSPSQTGRIREKGALKVAREIVGHIRDERIPAGQKYLSEAEAIERHQVARGTLREALRYLQIQGVLEIRPGPNGGHFVAQPRWESLASTIALLLQFSEASIESIIEARGAIDPGMASLAAANATPEEVEELDRLLSLLKASLGDYDTYYELYMDFWDQLSLMTRNPLFMFLSPALRRITWTAGIRPNEVQREQALGGLRSIRNAVYARDEARAFKAMKLLEASYISTTRSEYPREIAKTISWSDFR